MSLRVGVYVGMSKYTCMHVINYVMIYVDMYGHIVCICVHLCILFF